MAALSERRRGVLRYVLLFFALIWALFPIYWMAMTSIKPSNEWVVDPPVWVTSNPTAENYMRILGLADVSGATQFGSNAISPIINSIIIVVTATTLSVIIGTLAAWAISRYRIGGNQLPLFLLTPRMFPPIAVVLPLLILYSTLNLVNTYTGLIITYTGFTIPFSVWMTKSFIDEVPIELEEAGMMDGLSRFQTFYRITIPLITSGLAATYLFIFILNWSEFLVAFILTNDLDTVPVFLGKLVSATKGTMFGQQAALGILSIIPMVLIGYFIYNHLARGFTFGAISR